ncbi:hypothetical protein [Streptomyces synnematoformans]|uniref:Uncharacterized protein n=1 Tax=Streptomyces synnematoformans TaxID=415721 RepID=A0ABN2XAX0_9ACTN
MARIQILDLPDEWDGDTTKAAFVVIVDQADNDSPLFTDGADIWPMFKADTGARHVLVTTDTLDIPANWATPDEDGRVATISIQPDFTGFRDQLETQLAQARHPPAPKGRGMNELSDEVRRAVSDIAGEGHDEYGGEEAFLAMAETLAGQGVDDDSIIESVRAACGEGHVADAWHDGPSPT